MRSTLEPQEKVNSDDLLTSCNKCDTMNQIFDSKMFAVIRNFAQVAKAINEEQDNMSTSMNNTINTVNMIIDQLEENKTTLLRYEEEIKNLKNEIQQLKNHNEPIDQIQNRSISLSSQSSSDFISNDFDSIKAEISKLKRSSKDHKIMQHDINCLKFEVKKLKSIHNDKIQPLISDQKNESTNQSLNNFNELKNQIDQIKALKETNAAESDSNAKLNSQQININSLRDEVKDIKKNAISLEEIKKIKKQIKKLSKRIDSLENKNSNKIKINNDSEESSNNIKENKEEKEDSDDVFNSIQSLNLRISALESETNKLTDTITKPKVQQIFVDLPNSRACNLLFRTPNQQKANTKE